MSTTGELDDDLLERGSLGDAAVQEDPTPYHHALHRRPLHYDPRLGFFICSTYELMRRSLRDPETFSSVDSQRADALREPPAEVVELRRQSYPAVNTLVTNDPPSHTRFRRLIDDPFRPRGVAALRDAIRDVAEETVDAFAQRGEFEAVSELAIPVPIKVIADMLGLDRALAPRIKAWSDASVDPLGMMIDEARLIECTRLIKEFQDHVAAELEDRLERPREDLLTSLVTARDGDGEGFSMPEMLSLTQQLLVAGNETTTNAIAAGVQRLIEHPAIADRLRHRRDQTELRRFAEEVLRLESPVQGLFRIVTRDVTIDGVDLPAGARVMLRFAAANRDPAQFADPDRLDVERRNAGTHLAFGAGIHHCLGATLAREELVATFDVLLRRAHRFALAPGGPQPRHHPSLILRGLESLPVRFDPL